MLRHCTMAELLEIRDGEGTAAARAHVEACAACRAELERAYGRASQLRALPTLRPPRDRWPVVRDVVVAARRRRRRWGVAAGLAAAVLVGVAVVPAAFRGGAGPAQVAEQMDLETLVQRSRALEESLWALDRQSRVMDGITAAVIADMEDRIALIDLGLEEAGAVRAEPEDVAPLWRQRVALMGALVDLHVRQVGYTAY